MCLFLCFCVFLCVCVLPVAAGLYASALQLSSPATTPTAFSSVCSAWLRHGCVPETSACARRGPGPLSSCVGCCIHLPVCPHRCSCRLLAVRAGSGAAVRAASAVGLEITGEKKGNFSNDSLCLNGKNLVSGVVQVHIYYL